MHEYVVLDVFTRTPLQGNPLAVFPSGDGLDGATMQRVAREMNLSETVFLGPGDDDADASARIFTPAAELRFAGHPVLGSAFVVAERAGSERVRLRTGAGIVPVTLTREAGELVHGEMEQPVPTREGVPAPEQLLRALGAERSLLPIRGYRNGPLHVYVQLPDVDSVLALRPDLRAVAELLEGGVSCFAFGDGYVETRVFVPALGVAEDPATGSAAGPLALHLALHGGLAFGQEIEVHQGTVIGRPSVLRARVEGSAERVERVLVGGGAVQVAEGRLRV